MNQPVSIQCTIKARVRIGYQRVYRMEGSGEAGIDCPLEGAAMDLKNPRVSDLR
jgi:hypothetical protein